MPLGLVVASSQLDNVLNVGVSTLVETLKRKSTFKILFSLKTVPSPLAVIQFSSRPLTLP